jgi:putative phage-type endonuclease
VNIIECGEQGGDAWKQIRLGKVTASCVADIIAKTKSGYSTSRANYRAKLVAERLTGVAQDGFTNGAMKWGTDTEPQARAAYEFYKDVDVGIVGFVAHPTIAMAGCSPDGIVGTEGLVEFKCPTTAVHIDTLLGASIDGKYITQCQWQMACCPDRKWVDLASFDPRLVPEMQLLVRRIPRDDAMIAHLETEVRTFLVEVAQTVEELSKKYLSKEAA